MHRYDVNVCKPATGLLLPPRPTTYERCSSSALHAAQRLRLLLPAFFAAGLLPADLPVALLPAPVDAASALSGASSSSSSPSSSSAPVAAAAAAPLAAPARSAARNSASSLSRTRRASASSAFLRSA